MSLFLWASAAVLFCAGALCGLARLYYRHGQAVEVTAVLLAAAALLVFGLHVELPFWLSNALVLLVSGIPALPFLAVAVYLARVVQRRRVATP